MTEPEAPAQVETIMRQIRDSVRRDLRQRLVAQGGRSEYADEALFRQVQEVLQRAAHERHPDALLLPGLLGDAEDWDLRSAVRFSSHRPGLGRMIVAVKRRLLLPLVRWLYEFELENVSRQQRVNRLLFACIEELAIDNARLRDDLRRRESHPAASP